MPQDHVLLVRRWIDAAGAGLHEELLELAHADIVLRPVRQLGLKREYRGHEGVRTWLLDFRAAGPMPKLAVDRITAHGPDRVVVEGSLTPGTDYTGIFETRDGLLALAEGYLSDRSTLEQIGRLPAGLAGE